MLALRRRVSFLVVAAAVFLCQAGERFPASANARTITEFDGHNLARSIDTYSRFLVAGRNVRPDALVAYGLSAPVFAAERFAAPVWQGASSDQKWSKSRTLASDKMKTGATELRDRSHEADTSRRSAVTKAHHSSSQQSGDDVFGSVRLAFGSLDAVDRMSPIYREIADEEVFADCDQGGCSDAIQRLGNAIASARDADFATKMAVVQSEVNAAIRYREDRHTHGELDVWSKPSNTMERATGDCEDYAILKMALLRQLDIPMSSMSIVVLRDNARNLYHAVLSVRTNAGHFVLDNTQDDVVRDTELANYMPLFSVVAGKGYIHGRRIGSGPSQTASIASLKDIAPGSGYLAADLR